MCLTHADRLQGSLACRLWQTSTCRANLRHNKARLRLLTNSHTHRALFQNLSRRRTHMTIPYCPSGGQDRPHRRLSFIRPKHPFDRGQETTFSSHNRKALPQVQWPRCGIQEWESDLAVMVWVHHKLGTIMDSKPRNREPGILTRVSSLVDPCGVFQLLFRSFKGCDVVLFIDETWLYILPMLMIVRLGGW